MFCVNILVFCFMCPFHQWGVDLDSITNCWTEVIYFYYIELQLCITCTQCSWCGSGFHISSETPLTLIWFQRISSHSERTELSPSWTREHKLKNLGMLQSRWMEWLGLGWNASVCLAQELLYVALDAAGQELPAVALEWDAVGPNEELLKVPGHVVPADGTPDNQLGVGNQRAWVVAGERQLFPEELEEGVGILPVHIHLLKESKLGLESISRADVFQRQEDFLILAVLLRRLKKIRFRETQCRYKNVFANAIKAKKKKSIWGWHSFCVVAF